MGLAAFNPVGGNTRISSTAASATVGVQPSTGYQQHALLINQSTNDAWVAASKSSAVAAIAATTVPSSGLGVLLLQRTSQLVVMPPNAWVSAITTGGQADVIVQPGNAGTLG